MVGRGTGSAGGGVFDVGAHGVGGDGGGCGICGCKVSDFVFFDVGRGDPESFSVVIVVTVIIFVGKGQRL